MTDISAKGDMTADLPRAVRALCVLTAFLLDLFQIKYIDVMIEGIRQETYTYV